MIGAYGTMYFDASAGAYQFVPDPVAMNAYGADVGDTFTFRVTDSFGASADTTFIAKMNEAPTLAADTGAVSENATLSVSAEQGVLANDTDATDADSGTLVVSAIMSGTTGSTTAIAANGLSLIHI